ncbi:MAG: hypothetical protein ACNI27_06915 [Desulfovibrio sp.]
MLFLYPEGIFVRNGLLEKATIAPAQQFRVDGVNHTGKELLRNEAAESDDEWLERINALGICPVDESAKPDGKEYIAGMPEVNKIENGWAIAAYPNSEEAPVVIPNATRLIDGNLVTLGTAERLHNATTVSELKGVLSEIILGREVVGVTAANEGFALP